MENFKKLFVTVFVLIPSTFLAFLSCILFGLAGISNFFITIPAIIFCIAVYGLWFFTYVKKEQLVNHPKKILVFLICGVLSLFLCFPMGVSYIINMSAPLPDKSDDHYDNLLLGFVLLAPCFLGLLYIYDLFKIRRLFFKSKLWFLHSRAASLADLPLSR